MIRFMFKKIIFSSLILFSIFSIAKADIFQKGSDVYLQITTNKDNTSISFLKCSQSAQSCSQLGKKESYSVDELKKASKTLQNWGLYHTFLIAKHFLAYLFFNNIWNSALDATSSDNAFVSEQATQVVVNVAEFRKNLNPVYDFRGADALSMRHLKPNARFEVKNIEEYLYYLEHALNNIK